MILLRSRSLGLSGAVSPSIIGHEAEWAFCRDIPRYLVKKITIPRIKNQNFRDFALWIFSDFSYLDPDPRDFNFFLNFGPLDFFRDFFFSRFSNPNPRDFRIFGIFRLNRYRRGLETYQQAKTSKSGHAIFFFFSDTSERRVWLSTESKILASTFGRFRLYRFKSSSPKKSHPEANSDFKYHLYLFCSPSKRLGKFLIIKKVYSLIYPEKSYFNLES